MSRHHKSAWTLVLAALATLCSVANVRAQSGITLGQLAGFWQIVLVGNTGCGQSSMVYWGTMDASGTATGQLFTAGGCPGSSTQTFTITSLNADGSGTAVLSCGSGCGWNFNIQVAADGQTFNLVDVVNGGANVLAGTAVVTVASEPVITIDQLAGPWQIAIVGNTGCGQSSMLFTGTLNASGTATGTLTASSGGCPPGSSTQTFKITVLNQFGRGTASLSCGQGCGWNFSIQVAADKQTFNLADVGANVLAGNAVAAVPGGPAITIDQLAGPWQIALVGDTGCGRSSMLFTGTLNASGTATGALTSASGGCPFSSNIQTFRITSLNPNGSGTASLSCGSSCGWNFNIQVATDKETFNLVDVMDGGANVLAGNAVAVVDADVIVPYLIGDTQTQAFSTLKSIGLQLRVLPPTRGGVVIDQNPSAGVVVEPGSFVTVTLSGSSSQ